MQSEQYHSERFVKGLMLRTSPTDPLACEEGTDPNDQKNTSSEPGKGFRPSTEFIITPETFGPTFGSDLERTRYEIVFRLHETCYARVYSFLRRSVPADVADDLAQETFLRLLSHKKIERMSISISYLFRIAQNLLRRRYNRLVRSQRHLHDQLKHQMASEHKRPNTGFDAFEVDSDQLGRAIDQLSPKEREVVKLIVCQGLSYSAAAKVMDVPVSTVNNWKFRALSRLREFICTDHGAELEAPNETEHRNARADLGRDPLGGTGQQESGQREPGGTHQIEIQRRTTTVDFGARAAG
jgi:RNA polymerase sigma factor (sigma-70 family)